MNIFWLLAAFIVVGVGGLTLIGLVITLCTLRKAGWKKAMLGVLVCCLPLALVLMAYAKVFGPKDYTSAEGLAKAYEKEFHSRPPPDVTDLKFRVASVGDWFGAWMYFHASSETVDELIKKFVPCDGYNSKDMGEGANAPDWWRPDEEGIEVYYWAEGWDTAFGNSIAYMGVNRAKDTVYFHHSCAD